MQAYSLLILTISTVQSANIVEILQQSGATTLVDLAVKAGLADTLTGDGPLTVFAPTNNAFAALPSSLVQALMDDTELLKKVLLYHVVAGSVTSNQAANNIKLDSVEGSPLIVNKYSSKYYHHYRNSGFITINGKKVIKADKIADNGVVHFIDGVMLIPKGDLVDTLAADDRFSTLVTAVQAAGLVDTVKNADLLTIFAPTNDAFAKVPSDALNGLLADKDALSAVLLRHVVPGTVFAKGVSWANLATVGGDKICTKVYRNGAVQVGSHGSGKRTSAKVIDTDLTATNGVVHAIDSVI